METQYINLNMTPTGVTPTFHISQYDVGRLLGLIVHSGGATVDLDTYTCTIEATRSDGTAITSAVATTDNIGTFEVTPTMSNKADKYRCQLVIVDENSKRIASLPFDIEVTKAAMDENAESIEEDASLYQQYTEAVQGAIAEANADIQAEENARIAAVSAEATARANADTTLQNNIDAEATARQNADATLQGNIDSEAATRASADSNLQSQINQIIAPSGEAPSAAEVQNARIGADGVTYDTLGDAVRANDSALKNALEQTIDDIGATLKVTPTKKKGIHVQDNGTSYISDVKHDAFYVPVVKDNIYTWVVGAGTDTWPKLTYSSNVPEVGGSCTFLDLKHIVNDSVTFEYTAQADGYLCVTCWEDNTSVSLMDITRHTDGKIQDLNGEITRLDEKIVDVSGFTVTLTPTKKTGIHVQDNGTSYISDVKHDAFYVPVVKDNIYTWVVGKAAGSPWPKLTYSSNVPEVGGSCTFLDLKQIVDNPVTFEYTAQADGYLCVTCWINETNVSLMTVTERRIGMVGELSDQVNMLESDISGIDDTVSKISSRTKNNNYAYTGDAIVLNKRYINVRELINVINADTSFPDHIWIGGLAVYNNLAFCYFHTGYVAVFNIDSGELIATGRSSATGNSMHANCASFDYQTIDGNYPLVYVSRCHKSGSECYVDSLSIDTNTKTLTSTAVQTITYSGTLFDGTNDLDWCVDSDHRHLLMLTNGNVAVFNLPDTSQTTAQLTDTDIILQYTYPTDVVRQAACTYENMLFMLGGYANEGMMYVMDLTNGVVKSTVNIANTFSTQEPEGICVYKNRIYITTEPAVGLSVHLFEIKPD